MKIFINIIKNSFLTFIAITWVLLSPAWATDQEDDSVSKIFLQLSEYDYEKDPDGRIQIERQRRFEKGDPEWRSVTQKDVKQRDYEIKWERKEERERTERKEKVEKFYTVYRYTKDVPVVGIITHAIANIAEAWYESQ